MFKYKKIKEILDSYSSFETGKYPHIYKIFSFENKNNLSLKTWLNEIGFFDFNGLTSIVSYHQIVAFCCLKHPATLPKDIEIHHINGITKDNHPSNLMYISKADHSIVTKYQRNLTYLKVKSFYKLNKSSSHIKTSFNRQGKKIVNWVKFIITVLARTVLLTGRWYTSILNPSKYKEVKLFISRWVRKHINSDFLDYYDLQI